jgi:serine/threonine-protein kinase
MEYVAGQNLAQLIKSGQRLTETEALHYIQQIASALKTLHQAGLVHRSVRPENIIQRTGTNSVMLTGFGLTCEFPASMRQAYNSLLSAGYTPIEQYIPETEEKKQDALAIAGLSRPSLGVAKSPNLLTPATDIYSLAATFYYLLAGEAPVPAPLRDRIPLYSLQQIQTQLCPGIERAILWGLEINTRERPQTIENWLDFLEEQQLLERQKEEAENNQLSMFPSSLLMLFIFLLTGVISGWLGFNLTRQSISLASIDQNPSTNRSLKSIEGWRSPEFPNQDPSKPLFGRPSVEGNPNLSPQSNIIPETSLNSLKAEPNNKYTPTIPSSPTPTTVNPTPGSESQDSQYYEPETQPEQAQSYTPNVESPNVEPPNVESPSVESPNVESPSVEYQETPSYVSEPETTQLPEKAIPPSPVEVPKVEPLPSEPIESSIPAPDSSPASAEMLPLPVNDPALAPLPEVQPLLPNSDRNSVQSAVRSSSGLETDVPFPEPSSN